MEYTVIRQHYGDKEYFSGDTRTVTNEADAKYLINLGLIAPKDAKPSAKTTTKATKKWLI